MAFARVCARASRLQNYFSKRDGIFLEITTNSLEAAFPTSNGSARLKNLKTVSHSRKLPCASVLPPCNPLAKFSKNARVQAQIRTFN